MSNDEVTLSVDELAEYCRTQAGLLSGFVETIGAEADDMLAEIDEEIAEIQRRLAEQANGTGGPTASTAGADEDGDEIADLEELTSDLDEKQAIAEAKQARMAAFQDLAAAYVDLAEELESTVDDGREALDRVVRFEHERDAPAHFDDRQTVLEAAAESDGSSAE